MASYTIPPGNKVSFPFSSATPYAVPKGDKVSFRFGGLPGTLFLVGSDASAFGTASLRNSTAQIFTSGWDSGFVSGNLVLTKGLLAQGFAAGAFGQAKIFNLSQEVRLGGISAFSSGAAWVSLGTRRLTGVTLADTSLFGTATMSGGVRIVDMASRGIAPVPPPPPVLTFRVREMFPTWFIATQWGRPLVDFQHNVFPAPFGRETFGQAEVYRPRFIVDMQDLGIRGTVWGDTTLRLAKQFVAPPGWIGGGPTSAEQFGRTQIYNLKQIVEQQFEVTPSDGGVFGDFNLVMNRNQMPRPDGLAAGRYGTPDLRNAARIVAMPAFIDFTLWGNSLVAPAIRTIELVGTETTGWGSVVGTIVYNGARVLAPNGIDPGTMGKPSRVWSNLQTLRLVGADQSVFGTQMIDFAIRTVSPFSLSGPPPFGNVDVENWIRYVRAPGFAVGGAGVPTLEQHFTIIAPKSVLPPANAFGDGRVRNVTPEVAIYGWIATLFGTAAIHNQFEHFAFQSFGGETFGRHVVKDRRITVLPPGVGPLPISQLHQVRKVSPDPPSPQILAPTGADTSVVGHPGVQINVLYASGSDSSIFGSARFVNNGILAKGITPPYDETTGVQCGIPTFNGTRFLFPAGIEAPSNANIPVADVGPRYVWAPQGYPYTTGYWQEQGQQMDAVVHGGDHPERPVFGSAVVTHRDRELRLTGSSHGSFGAPGLVQRPLYIRAQGSTFQKLGFPTLNGGGDVGLYGFDMSVFGSCAVNHAEDLGPRTIRPVGLAAGTMPRQDVQLFNRQLLVSGFNAFLISPPAAPTWPRTSSWISNAYAPFSFVGIDQSSFGNPWVSNSIRYLDPAGWQSEAVAADSPGSFRDRMRVTKQMRITDISVGSTSVMGTPWTSLGRHGIAPAGMEPPGMGRVAVASVSRINPDGFQDGVFGDVQRWEAGKVKPYGDDLAAYGRAVIGSVVRPTGMVGAVGSPRMGMPVGPAAIDAGEIGAPTLVASWCGNRAIAVHEGAAGVFGQPKLEVST